MRCCLFACCSRGLGVSPKVVFPHARGDGRKSCRYQPAVYMRERGSFPHARGDGPLVKNQTQFVACGLVSPTRVGMVPFTQGMVRTIVER